jgi:hypothetical protein
VSPARLYGDSDSGRGSIETESHHQVSILWTSFSAEKKLLEKFQAKKTIDISLICAN